MTMLRALVVGCALGAATACGPGSPGGPTINNKMNTAPPPQASVVSTDILDRDIATNHAGVKHILIGWAGADGSDPRAQKRTKQDAEVVVHTVLDELKKGTDFDAMMKQYSEDPGSSQHGTVYKVAPDAQYVIEFKQLALRLKVDEVGVVESGFGFHIMKRVE